MYTAGTKNHRSSVNSDDMEKGEEDWLAAVMRTDYESCPHGVMVTRYSTPPYQFSWLVMIFPSGPSHWVFSPWKQGFPFFIFFIYYLYTRSPTLGFKFFVRRVGSPVLKNIRA